MNLAENSNRIEIKLNDTESLITNQSCDRDCFLERNLGPRKNNLSFIIIMCLVFIVILLTGLFGNISTCCVIILNNCMHTTTNYYLFSLAVSDVLSLIIGKSLILKLFFFPKKKQFLSF